MSSRVKSVSARKRRSRYATRLRDPAYMQFVKSLPCLLADRGECAGAVEADHAGERALGRKAPDDTCIPLCRMHHAHRHAAYGFFATLTPAQRRDWRTDAILLTRARWASERGVPVGENIDNTK